MTLDVGIQGYGDDPLMIGTLKVTGTLKCHRNLDVGEAMTITIANADGEVVASAIDAEISAVPIIGHDATQTAPAWIERQHKVKVTE